MAQLPDRGNFDIEATLSLLRSRGHATIILVTREGQPEFPLLEQGVQALQQLLGSGWTVTATSPATKGAADSAFDAQITVRAPDHGPHRELLTVVKERLSPSQVARELVPVSDVLREAGAHRGLLVLSRWLSPRSQRLLQDHGIGYLDLTGNVWLSITHPAIRLHTQGADRAPGGPSAPSTRTVTLSGPRAGRIVRFLTDFQPPYRAKAISDALGVSAPWVSRLLAQLEDELLIQRIGRDIVEVNWADLLRARAQAYTLLKNNSYIAAVAPNGVKAVLGTLREQPTPRIAVTGPYAAREIAPLTAGEQLMLYVDSSAEDWVDILGLLPTRENADVLLLRAQDDIVFERRRDVNGVPHVAMSQVVLDGLGGPGRMPAEAEAVLLTMQKQESAWRLPWKS